jgi:hypothetical protein
MSDVVPELTGLDAGGVVVDRHAQSWDGVPGGRIPSGQPPLPADFN